MTSTRIYSVLIFLHISCFVRGLALGKNLTCYQCERNTNTECLPEELLPCSSTSDRCVTHITKTAERGFSIKRECGLGPCGFDDDMMNRGLGLGNCDTSKKEYFCLSCCRESGCNKNACPSPRTSLSLLLLALLSIVIINIFRRFQPPYVSESEKW